MILSGQNLNKNPNKERQANIRGNLVGIIEFSIVLNLGVAVVLDGHSPDMTFNLIPLYVVPLFILLHIFSLQKLRTSRNEFLNNIYLKLNRLSDRPILLVWDLKDFAFKEPERARFESMFDKHQTVLLDNAGHFIQEDAPDKIATAIRQFYQ